MALKAVFLDLEHLNRRQQVRLRREQPVCTNEVPQLHPLITSQSSLDLLQLHSMALLLARPEELLWAQATDLREQQK